MRHLRSSRDRGDRGRTAKSRLVLGFLDQGIVSATGLLIFVSAAQFLSPGDLGYFSFGVATCLLIVSLSRAICGESLLVRAVESSNTRPSVFKDSRSMLGLAMTLSLAGAGICTGIALLGESPNLPLLASAIASPGLVIQDSLRFCFVALQRTQSLLANDVATLVIGASAILVSGSLTHDVFTMLISWGAASLAVSLTTLVVNAMVPSFTGALSWLRETWRSSSAFFTENALGALVGYMIVVILTVFVAPSEVAAFRATLVVYGVASLVINFLRTQVLRELRPQMINTTRGLVATSGKLAVPVLVPIVGMLVVLMLIPESLGKVLMRDTWSLVAALLIPGAIHRLFAGFSTIPTITLRVQGITWRATVIKISVLLISLVLGPLGALYAGAAGALYADSFAYGLCSILLFALSLKRAKEM